MAGGLIQLVAYGTQDLFLTHDPQITFFKVVYRRHTNFSLEPIPQNFLHTPDFGKRVTCVLSRNGDLIRKIHVVITLPAIPQFIDTNQEVDPINKFAWVRRIGYAIINTVEIEIGGELIDRHYGDWLNIWHELTIPNRINLDKIIGDVTELTSFTNGKQSYELMVPLQFWFNRIAGLALPVVSLQYNPIKINLELSALKNCYILAPTDTINIDNSFVNFIPNEYLTQTVNGVTSLARFIYYDIINQTLYISRISPNGFLSVTASNPSTIQTHTQQQSILYAQNPNGTYVNAQYFIYGLTSGFRAMPKINAVEIAEVNNSVNFNNITLQDCFLLVEYVFLDDEERVRFSQARHEYLIEQLYYNGSETINGLHQSFKVGFTQPCKELIWVSQLNLALNTRINDIFNYSDSLILGANGNSIGNNIITSETILFNGFERITMRDSAYFDQIQIYQNHRHNPNSVINVYAFALHPESHQPSGTANLSKIDNVNLKVSVNSTINFNNTADLRIYGIVYNILRVANGISGVVFSIDY